MRLSLKAITLAGALLWGGAILLVGLINLAWPDYGLSFLQMTSSVYPGFHAAHGIGSVAEQIQDDLLKLHTVACDEREFSVKIGPQQHSISLKFAQRQRNHLPCRFVQVQ